MFINPMLKKMVTAKIADCLNGEPGGLQRLLTLYRNKDIQWIDNYARTFAKLVDPDWEKMINDPQNRWYKEGSEYRELFRNRSAAASGAEDF